MVANQEVFCDVLNRTLPNAWRFHLPNEIYFTSDGRAFDGTEIPADIRVPFFTLTELEMGRDSALDEATRQSAN
jgi:C-terminal processing protease CtpA/Prc